MHILLMSDSIPPASLGGAGRIVWETAKGLVHSGHRVTILTAGEMHTSSAREGISIVTIPSRSYRWAHYRSVFSYQCAREVLSVIDTVKPDVIHGHVLAWQCGYRWIPAARRRGIPIVVTCHDVMNISCGRIMPMDTPRTTAWRDLLRARWQWNPLRRRIIHSLLSTHCRVLCVSDALRTKMEEFGYTRLTTLHNGIDLTFWKATGDQVHARRTLGLPLDAPCFLLAGRLGKDKGTEMVEQTLPASAHLLVAGIIPAHTFASLGSRLHFVGNQSPEHMRLLYAACDAVLVPSLCLDCFPTVCLEAMACSRPVLASSWGGAKESVVDGSTGWILDPLDASAWNERLAWCTNHRSDLLSLGAQGRAHMEDCFSIETYLHTLLPLYHEDPFAHT